MISKQTKLLITCRTMKLSLKIRLTLQAQPRSGTWGTLVYLDNVWLRARPEREWDAMKERQWLRETRARERDGVTERERGTMWLLGRIKMWRRYSSLEIKFINLGFHFLKITEIVFATVEFHLGFLFYFILFTAWKSSLINSSSAWFFL